MTPEFFAQAGYSVGLLDTAMNGNLLPCLGQIMQKHPFESLSSRFVLEQVSTCPFSKINATEFMQFWLFHSEIPIVSIQIEKNLEEQLVKHNKSRFDLDFDLQKEPLFFANMYSKGNFLVKYPDSVYEAFFDWI